MERTGFLGIDVSKGYADFQLLDEGKNELGSSFKLYDTRQGHEALFRQLGCWKEQYNFSSIVCGVESTGGYENNWYNDLLLNGQAYYTDVVRLNPRGVKHQGQSKMTRTITDKVSAKTIAYQLIENKDKLLELQKPSIEEAQARRYYHYIGGLQQQKTRLSNQLDKLVYTAFPEVLAYARNGLPNWLLGLLRKYPVSGQVARVRVGSILKIKGISRQKAETLKEKAKVSVGIKDDRLLGQAIKGIVNQLIGLKKTIKEEKQYLESHYTSPDVALLNDIKGIGVYTAIGAVMEIEDVTRFDKASKMASYFGVHPLNRQSGDGVWETKMSKQGRASYRSILYMGARNAVNHNPYFKEIYDKFRAKGMSDGEAIGVIMHKLTRVFYGILKSKKPFDPNIDKQNQNKSHKQETKLQSEEERKAIEQELQTIKNAPCSNRTYKRKKAELPPQTSDVQVNARSVILPETKIEICL